MARDEVLRFALLVTMTIALATVAFRINSSSSSDAGKPPARPVPHASATVTPSVLPTSSTRTSPGTSTAVPQQGSGTAAGAGRPGGGRPGTSSGSSPVAVSEPVLPNTGWDGAMKLTAFAFVLIGGGASMRVAASSYRR